MRRNGTEYRFIRIENNSHKMSEADIMKFQEWMPHRDTDSNWTTVAKFQKYKNRDLEFDFFIISVIAETDVPEKLLTKFNWSTMVEFGNPGIWEYQGEVNYDANSVKELENSILEPFVIRRTWVGKSIPPKFELIQDFILFYNLFFNEKEKMFKALSETGTEINVIKISNEKYNEKIEISTKFLRNYLAFKNKILVRQHSHSIRNVKTLDELGITASRAPMKSNEYNFALVIDKHDTLSNFNSFGHLQGKDIILPFEKRKHLLDWSKEYCTFIIGVDDQGENIESTCEEEKLGNFFGKEGVQFLTPVFFNREVLKKYHDAPSKYTVGSTNLSCGHHWGLPIDTNYVDLVQVYLGDLSHIPYEEQQHWRLHNVLPEGGITRSRFTRDVEAGFADPEDIMFRFAKALSEFQEKFENRFGFNPFKPLNENDRFIEKSIRVPVNNEITEFEQQIGYLAKILPDSIDIKSMRKKLEEEGTDSDKLDELKDKKIRTFEYFLQQKGLRPNIIQNLDAIQRIKSSGSSHRKGDDYEKIMEKYGLNKTTYIDFFKNLIEKTIISFENL